ncbi:MAG: conserved phage C-terminal domain-containing protein [Atribacterota bacterium]|nr:conserved phage C-terminal domain-containing protein [Atribacterota bacterium]
MAKYRPIQIRIWKDPDFEKYNANMKLIFLYLCTNELTTESGIYAISTRTISQETNIPVSSVNKLLANGLKNIAYDFTNSCVFIKNFLKYSVGGSPDLIQKSINNNYEEFNTPLWNEFIEKYPEKSKGFKRVDKPFVKDSIEIDNSNRNIIEEIISYLNSKAKKNFRSTSAIAIKNITARLNEKYTIDDFKKVIDIKCSHWLEHKKDEPDMSIYLSPDTLFGTKFEKYLNQNEKRQAVQEAVKREDKWKEEKEDYENKPIPQEIKEHIKKMKLKSLGG